MSESERMQTKEEKERESEVVKKIIVMLKEEGITRNEAINACRMTIGEINRQIRIEYDEIEREKVGKQEELLFKKV